MIEVYKIGVSFYKSIDLNSGMYEFKLIQKELKRVKTNKKVLVLINGKCGPAEKLHVKSLIKEYEYVIFIATDAICFTGMEDIIENCNLLLHQCPNHKFDFNIKQNYSFVPELFYKNFTRRLFRSNKLLFGGGMRNNMELLKSIESTVDCSFYVKWADRDERIDYHKYIQKQRRYKYSLIITRQEYVDIGWITSRFVEAISTWSWPIVHCDYDKFNYFPIPKFEKVEFIKNCMKLNRTYVIKNFRKRFKEHRHNLSKLIGRYVND